MSNRTRLAALCTALFAVSPVAPGITTARADGVGLASWYQLPGRTACGGRHNPDAMTAAHRSYPCGSKITVTNLANGRSAVLTVVDRGPSSAAASSMSRAVRRGRSGSSTGAWGGCASRGTDITPHFEEFTSKTPPNRLAGRRFYFLCETAAWCRRDHFGLWIMWTSGGTPLSLRPVKPRPWPSPSSRRSDRRDNGCPSVRGSPRDGTAPRRPGGRSGQCRHWTRRRG